MTEDLPGGARELIKGDPSRITYVEVDDIGLVRDVDTPADYEEIKKKYG